MVGLNSLPEAVRNIIPRCSHSPSQYHGLAMVKARSLVPPAASRHIPGGGRPVPAVIKGSLSSSSYSKLKYHIVFLGKMDYRLREKCVQLRNPCSKAPSPITEAHCHQAGAEGVPCVLLVLDRWFYFP